MKQIKKLTIVVATYPEDPYTETIDHLLRSYKGYEKEFDVAIVGREKKRTFSQNNNIGAREARTPYVLFLNSDTEPKPDFYEHMIRSLESHKQFSVIGAKLFFTKSFNRQVTFKRNLTFVSGTAGNIQHAGISFTKKFLPYEYCFNCTPDHPDVQKSRLMAAVTGACMLVRRDEFLELGGFDENFKNGWEDTDLCLRYAEKGKLCFYNADAVVSHHYAGSQYFGRFDNEDDNFNYWFEKWHESGRIFKIFYGIPDDVVNLDIGCGFNKKEGYFGVDKFPCDADLIFNLETVGQEETRLPFGTSTIKNIYCAHTLEHLENTFEIMNDFHRVLKKDGWLYLILPHAFSWSAWASPFHKKYFIPQTFTEYFASDKREEKMKIESEVQLLLPWHIEEIDATPVPVGMNPFEIAREFTVKMRPLK